MPPPNDDALPSSNQVRKAGSKVRRYLRGEATDDDYESARKVIQDLRAAHAAPLVRVNSRLRYTCKVLELPQGVTQRLKKLPTIIDKLQREPTLDLRQMRDIGGCRLVLASAQDIERVAAYLASSRRWKRDDVNVGDPIDYLRSPRVSGYRALHLPVVDGGRTIEIQLRTPGMHRWATLVEELSGALGVNYKQDGDHPIQSYFAATAELHAFTDGLRGPLGLADLTAVDTLRQEALKVL